MIKKMEEKMFVITGLAVVLGNGIDQYRGITGQCYKGYFFTFTMITLIPYLIVRFTRKALWKIKDIIG